MPADIREQVESCRRTDAKRFTYPVIARWLKAEAHIDLHPDTLRRHFNRHVEAG